MTTESTVELNRTTRLVLQHLKDHARITPDEIARLAGIRPVLVEAHMADAVDDKIVRRIRWGGEIVYELVPHADKPAAKAAEAAPRIEPIVKPAKAEVPAQVQRGRGRAKGQKVEPLPFIDVEKIGVTTATRIDAKAKDAKDTKWGPLFIKLMKMPINKDGFGNDIYPTSLPIDAIYHKALQAAARKFCLDKKGSGILIKSVQKGEHCYVQRLS